MTSLIKYERDFNPGLPLSEQECEHCHKIKNSVDYVANPYDEDVNDRIVKEWLCDDCYDDIATNI